MKFLPSILLVLLMMSSVVSAAEKLLVYVDAATDEDDWPSKALEDSATDIRKKIKGKIWTVTEDAEKADMTITVTNRYVAGTGEIAIRNDLLLGPVASENEAMQVEAIVSLRGGKTKAFRSDKNCVWGTCAWPQAWRPAADALRKQIEDWAKEHHERILALRNQ